MREAPEACGDGHCGDRLPETELGMTVQPAALFHVEFPGPPLCQGRDWPRICLLRARLSYPYKGVGSLLREGPWGLAPKSKGEVSGCVVPCVLGLPWGPCAVPLPPWVGWKMEECVCHFDSGQTKATGRLTELWRGIAVSRGLAGWVGKVGRLPSLGLEVRRDSARWCMPSGSGRRCAPSRQLPEETTRSVSGTGLLALRSTPAPRWETRYCSRESGGPLRMSTS